MNIVDLTDVFFALGATALTLWSPIRDTWRTGGPGPALLLAALGFTGWLVASVLIDAVIGVLAGFFE